MFLAFKTYTWLKYQIRAHYRRGHHVHSPYTYALFTNVLFERWQYYSFEHIEDFRRKNSSKLTTCPSDKPKYAQLLQRLCATNNAKTILQLGTGSGITAMYLASNDTRSTIYTCNRPENDLNDPSANFKLMPFENIKLCSYDSVHQTIAQLTAPIDILFVRPSQGFHDIDKWFEECKSLRTDTSIFIFDKIHADPETQHRWNTIHQSPEVTLSLDLYELGLVWFRHELKKQHYIVKY